MSFSKTMDYEEMPLKISKVSKRVGRNYDIRTMSSWGALGYLALRHKFGLLLTFTAVYVAFTLFGTLIVGLIESM
jgi:hypothetical protein